MYIDKNGTNIACVVTVLKSELRACFYCSLLKKKSRERERQLFDRHGNGNGISCVKRMKGEQVNN